MLIAIVMLAGGVIILTLGADRFVDGAVRLSRSLGVSTVLIGALVVGFGTSAPELLVSGLAAARDEIDLAVGNVVGSNVANVTFVLGVAALVAPLRAEMQVIRREGLLMVGSVGVLALLLWDQELSRTEGVLLLVGMVAAAALLTLWSRGRSITSYDVGRGAWRASAVTLVGLAATLGGAELLVRGATRLADELDITTAFVGLVIVAIGTSLPELATVVTAARRGEGDLLVGNVLGSNIFNSLVVAGTAGAVGPGLLESTFQTGVVFMVGAGIVAGVFGVTGLRVSRAEGVVLLVGFAAFSVLVA